MAVDLSIVFLTLILALLVGVLVWSLNQKSAQSNAKGMLIVVSRFYQVVLKYLKRFVYS